MVTRQQYRAIQNSLTPAEKELIKFYELQWHLRHYVPTPEETTEHLRKKMPRLRQTSVNYYLTRHPVRKALKDRGIPFEQHSREELTATQVAAAVTIMNFTDTRSNEDKLDQLGINSATYYAWLNDPQFKNLIDSLADQNLINIRPAAIGEFTKLINRGDWNAIKYFLETTGELQSNNVPQSEILLRMIIEVIQKHVKDQDVMAAIAQDLKQVASNRTIDSYVVPEAYDPDLENAKKMLGVL